MQCVASVGKYIAKNRYWCPTKKDMINFEKVMNERKKEMANMGGFVHCEIIESNFVGQYECTQIWESDVAYQQWMTSKFYHTNNLDHGIYQYMPTNKKISVPETYTPFIG